MPSTAFPLFKSIAGWRLNLLFVALGTLIAIGVVMLVERLLLGATGPNTLLTGTATGVIISTLAVGLHAVARARMASTHQHRLKEDVAHVQSRLDIVLEVAKLLFWEVDLITGELQLDHTKLTRIGLAEDAPVGSVTAWMALVHPEDQVEFKQKFEAAVLPGALNFEFEYRMCQADGGWGWMRTIGCVMERGSQGAASRAVGVTGGITQRKLDESALRDLGARFRAIFQTANVGISIVERSGKYLMVNDQWAQSLGYDLQEMQCQTYEQVIPIDEIEETRAKFSALLDGRIEKYRIEKRFEKKDHSVIWANLSTSVLKDERGQVSHVVNVLIDVTELRQAQDAAKQSKENYQILYAYAPVGILLVNRSGDVTEVNSAVLQILGSPSIEATKRINVLTFPPLVECGISAFFQRCFETGKPDVRDYSYHTMWGKTVQLLLRSSPIFDHQGRVIMVHAIMEDITARRQTEDKIQQLFHALEQSPVSIVITDTKPSIEYVNQKFLDTTGYSMAEVSGKNPRFLQSGETLQDTYLDLWGNISNGREWHGELKNRKKNGEVYWASLKISPITNSFGATTHFVAITEDISESKKHEAALLQSQKLESIGTLAGGVAHDFNNILNAILGHSSLALRKVAVDSPARSHIEHTIKASERAADLTNQLLAYSGKGKLYIQDIDLNLLVSQNVDLFKVSVSKTTKLAYQLGAPAPWISADIGQMQQVLMNLIINASDALALKPGCVTIRTSRVTLGRENSEYSKYTDMPLESGDYAVLQVADTGSGISGETLNRIFDPFFTTKFTGRGLGLSAVLGIIKAHKGGLRIDSTEGEGTLFEIVLPLVATTESDVPKRIAAARVDGEGKTILVIDDDEGVLELLEEIFSELNFQVICAPDPLDGIRIYREQQDIALVILDFSMPNMNGMEVLEQLLKINSEARVLLCSGYTEEATIPSSGQLRPAGFLQKPYDPDTLLDRVWNLLANRRSAERRSG